MGIYAAIAGALAAVATTCADRAIMRRRQRTLFAAACTYVSGRGIRRPQPVVVRRQLRHAVARQHPEIKGITFSSVFPACAVA